MFLSRTTLLFFGISFLLWNPGCSSSEHKSDQSTETDPPSTMDDTSNDPDTGSQPDTDEEPDTGSEPDTGNEPDTSDETTDTVEPTTDTPSTCVFHVSVNGNDDNDGTTWENAFARPSKAIEAASNTLGASGRCEVWISLGVYFIYQDSPTDSVRMHPRIDIYGGFLGNELDQDSRDWHKNPTVFDGHKSATNWNQIVYHVVTGANDAVLDGLIISGGAAESSLDPADIDANGGGMLNFQTSPTIRNCHFTENNANWDGAVANWQGSPSFENCVFSDNLVSGVLNSKSSASFNRCIFAGNRFSGAINNGKTTRPIFTNCVFAGNRYFGVESWYQASTTIIASTFVGNYQAETPEYTAAVYNLEATTSIEGSIVWGDTANIILDDEFGKTTIANSVVRNGFEGENNIDVDPLFVGSPLSQGTWNDVEFNALTGQTTLTDHDATWEPNAMAGIFLQPNSDTTEIGGPAWVLVSTNTSNTVTIAGDVSWFAKTGKGYTFHDIHLSTNSPCANQGSKSQAQKTDAGGVTRDDSPDMGAYEIVN